MLRNAWETYFHRHEKLILVVCGSVSAWIKKNILGNTGFTGRFSRDYLLPDWNAVMGLQFENLIVNNAMEAVSHFGIGNTTVESAAPYRSVRKSRNGDARGCQVDLLVQTPRTVYVVEVKRQNEIGPEIEDEVSDRMGRLPLRKGMSKRPVLVYDGHLSPSVEASGFFAVVVSGRKLLGL